MPAMLEAPRIERDPVVCVLPIYAKAAGQDQGQDASIPAGAVPNRPRLRRLGAAGVKFQPAHRQTCRKLRPVMHLSDGVLECALRIRAMCREARSKTGAGVYVLMDGAHFVYVLRSVSPAAERAADEHWTWLVAHYHDTPDVLQIMDDLADQSKIPR